jgi:hypothetical protein
MKKFIKINFGSGQKFIFNGILNNTFFEPHDRVELFKKIEKIEINTHLREATTGALMFGGVNIEIPPASWSIGVNPSHLIDTSTLKLVLDGETIMATGEIVLGISLKDDCIIDFNKHINNAFVAELNIWNVENYSTRNPHSFTLTGNWHSDNQLRKDIVINNSNDYWHGNIELLSKKPK